MPLERTVILGKFNILSYFIGAIFAWADVASDIAICVVYFLNGRYLWFGFCLAFAVAPSLLMTIAHLAQHCSRDGVSTSCKDIIYYAVLGSGVLKLKLFTLCARNFEDVWSRHGFLVLEEKHRSDIRSEKVYSFVEALIENIPQMILQGCVLIVQGQPIHWIQIVSIAISLIGLICTLASFENKILPGTQALNAYYIIIVTYTAFLLTARVIAIVTFLVAHTWLTAIVLSAHELACIVFYYYMNRARFRDKEVWWVAILLVPCYVFVFFGFKVKDLYLRTFEIKFNRSLVSSSFYYGFFAVENILMVTLYYSNAAVRSWYSSGATVAVIMLTLVGVFLNLVFTSIYFRDQDYHTRHVLRHQAARRSSRYTRGAHVRFSRRVRIAPEPTEIPTEPVEQVKPVEQETQDGHIHSDSERKHAGSSHV